MVRNAIESLYKGRCTIYEYSPVRDPVTKRTTMTEVMTVTDQPCRLSYGSKGASKPSDTTSTVGQEIKLFITPNLTIKAGSRIVVTQNDVTETYIASGKPAVYTNHQEVILSLEDVNT